MRLELLEITPKGKTWETMVETNAILFLAILFGHPNWRNILYSNNCLLFDNLSLFATAHVCTGIDRS